MNNNNIIWKDSSKSTYDLFVIISTLLLLLLTPLIPLAFWNFQRIKFLIFIIYIINISVFSYILIHLLYENNKWLYFNYHGIVIKWKPETGEDYEIFNWKQIKRINLLNSWNPKNYLRWKRIKKDLSHGLFFASGLYEKMLILETIDHEIFFVGINDANGFLDNLNSIKEENTYLNKIPLMNYGIKW